MRGTWRPDPPEALCIFPAQVHKESGSNNPPHPASEVQQVNLWPQEHDLLLWAADPCSHWPSIPENLRAGAGARGVNCACVWFWFGIQAPWNWSAGLGHVGIYWAAGWNF